MIPNGREVRLNAETNRDSQKLFSKFLSASWDDHKKRRCDSKSESTQIDPQSLHLLYELVKNSRSRWNQARIKLNLNDFLRVGINGISLLWVLTPWDFTFEWFDEGRRSSYDYIYFSHFAPCLNIVNLRVGDQFGWWVATPWGDQFELFDSSFINYILHIYISITESYISFSLKA